MTVAYEVVTRYAREKERRGLLDYDDLIDKALKLLANVDAAWVHFKLDLGIDHVLVDEAQDTSHKQWEIVRRLTAEFTAGAGARGVKRTMFAVGDEKQSIYSFQDAAPKEFAEMLRHFKTAHERSEQKSSSASSSIRPRRRSYSGRGGRGVQAGGRGAERHLRSGRISATHRAARHAAGHGRNLGAGEALDDRKEIEGWDAPFDTVSETSPRVKLARRIARAVRKLVDEHKARYGDILILVRQRGELFEAIIRVLKRVEVQVAGADRLVLTEHIAVMDLMALAEALLLPQDDLSLATVLRSPLFGFSDDDLFEIAYDRGRTPLRTILKRKAAEKKIFAEAAARLDELGGAARRETPFAFYAPLLGEGGGARRRILARLGPEADDALDEFLNLALEYERRETPSLQGFLTWLRDARAEVKRDMEIARDEVRVMTVHGAKGLEAPVVILADTMTPPQGPRPPRLLQLADGAMVWAGRKAEDVPSVATARAAANTEAEHEYRRLLYVAMTRAAERLIVCGADGIKKRPTDCWYDLVRSALDPMLVAEGDSEEKVLRFSKHQEEKSVARTTALTETVEGDHGEAPSWLRQAAPAEAKRPTRMSPSSAFDKEIASLCADRFRRRSAKSARARTHRASSDAIFARHPRGRAQIRYRAISQKRRRGFSSGRAAPRWPNRR